MCFSLDLDESAQDSNPSLLACYCHVIAKKVKNPFVKKVTEKIFFKEWLEC